MTVSPRSLTKRRAFIFRKAYASTVIFALSFTNVTGHCPGSFMHVSSVGLSNASVQFSTGHFCCNSVRKGNGCHIRLFGTCKTNSMNGTIPLDPFDGMRGRNARPTVRFGRGLRVIYAIVASNANTNVCAPGLIAIGPS